MKKTVAWNGLIAVAAVLAMCVFGFGCTDEKSTVNSGNSSALSLKGSIQGLVVDINNNPVSGAKVTLRTPNGAETKKTDDAGTYLFSGVPVAGDQALLWAGMGEGMPYLLVVESPVLKNEAGEKYTPYVTTYSAALLTFTSLQAIGAIAEVDGMSGEWRAVGNLQVQAITAIMRRPNATVSGYV